MNKTTIALITAAALGTSGLTFAQADGPNFSGRIDIRATDSENDTTDGINGANASSKLALSGGSDDAIANLSTFYYARMALVENGGQDVDYAYTGFSGNAGRLSFGIDDDLVYKYVGAYTDLYRGAGPDTDAIYSTGYGFGQEASAQYSIDIENFSYAAYVDTDNEGVNRTQLAASADFGVASVGAAYADSDASNNDSDFAFGGSVDAGVASLRLNYIDRGDDTAPYHVAAVVPLTDILTATVGYGDLDNATGDTQVNGMILADLGGGLDLNLSVRTGDGADGNDSSVTGVGANAVSAGVRYSF